MNMEKFVEYFVDYVVGGMIVFGFMVLFVSVIMSV